jgi:hypothetical protein
MNAVQAGICEIFINFLEKAVTVWPQNFLQHGYELVRSR